MNKLYNALHPGRILKIDSFTIIGIPGSQIPIDKLIGLLASKSSNENDIVGIRVYNVKRNFDDKPISGLIITAVDAFGKEINKQYYTAAIVPGKETSWELINANIAELLASLVDRKEQIISFFSRTMLDTLTAQREEGDKNFGIQFHLVEPTHPRFTKEIDVPSFLAVPSVGRIADGMSMIHETRNCVLSDRSSPGYATPKESDELIKVESNQNFILNRVARVPFGSQKGGLISYRLNETPIGFIEFKVLRELLQTEGSVGIQVFSNSSKSDKVSNIFFCAIDKNGFLLNDRILTNQIHEGVPGKGDFLSRRGGMMLAGGMIRFVSFFSNPMLDMLFPRPEVEYTGLAFYERESPTALKFKAGDVPRKVHTHFTAHAKILNGGIKVRSFHDLLNGIESPYSNPGNYNTDH